MGVGFMALGIHLLQKGRILMRLGKKASATVVKNVHDQKHGTYTPVVRFVTDQQEVVIRELSIGYNPPLSEGSEVEVLYDPNDLTLVEINSAFQLEVVPVILLVLGVCGLILAALELLEITNMIP